MPRVEPFANEHTSRAQHRRPRATRGGGLLAVLLLSTACGSGIGVVPRPLAEIVGLGPATPRLGPAAPSTRLTASRRSAATPAAAQLPSGAVEPATADDGLEQARQALLNGLRAEQLGESSAATAWYLWAAACAWDVLSASAATGTPAEALYDRAVGRYVELAFASPAGLTNRYAATTEGAVAVRLDFQESDFEADDLEALLDASTLRVRGLEERHLRSGIGAPLVVVRRRGGGVLERFLPEAGLVTPATAVLHFSERSPGHSARIARLLLLDPRRRPQTRIASHERPLAADFTAPLAHLAERIDPSAGLLRPDRVFSRKGLYLLERYSPHKTPLLMIHGLRSSPLVWMDLTNEILADDALREAYQVWHFSYPTGLPFLYAAFVLRDQLEELRHALLLETGEDLRSNPAVLIGHSMGGLVAKALAVDSQEALWRTVFPSTSTPLEGRPRDLELARRTLVLDASPFVGRIIYLATPHHGSPLADSLVGRLGSTLAGRPDELADAWRRLAEANAPSIAEELLQQLRRGGPTSIRALSPEDPLLEAFSRLEPPTWLPYHSVIGTAGGDPTAPDSDGVVTYASAHLPNAESEAVLTSGHSIHNDPRAIDEVLRILDRHLPQSERHLEARTEIAGLGLVP